MMMYLMRIGKHFFPTASIRQTTEKKNTVHFVHCLTSWRVGHTPATTLGPRKQMLDTMMKWAIRSPLFWQQSWLDE